MNYEYSEDHLIEKTAIDLFYKNLGWNTLIAYNKESFGEGSTLGRLNKKEVVLKRIFLEKIKDYSLKSEHKSQLRSKISRKDYLWGVQDILLPKLMNGQIEV